MTPDPNPGSYSCRKNFTLMTTDGYWNTAAETAGPVQLDGTTLVDKQDSLLTVNASGFPRPIWDGGSNSIRTTTDKSNAYSSLACVGNYANKTTTQITKTNTKVMQSTTQPMQQTSQTSLVTSRILKSTSATTQTVSYYQQYTTTWSATQTTVSMSTTQTTASYSQMQQATAPDRHKRERGCRKPPHKPPKR